MASSIRTLARTPSQAHPLAESAHPGPADGPALADSAHPEPVEGRGKRREPPPCAPEPLTSPALARCRETFLNSARPLRPPRAKSRGPSVGPASEAEIEGRYASARASAATLRVSGRGQSRSRISRQIFRPSPARPLASALLLCRVALIGLAFGLAAPATADRRPDAARAVVESAQRAYDLGLFEQALVDYDDAYALDPQPALLFNIGQCHRKLGELERAVHFYRRFVALAPESVNASLARDLADEVEALVADRERAAREEGAQRRRIELARLEAARAQAAARALARAALEARRLALTPTADDRGAAQIDESAGVPLWRRWWFWTGVGAVATGVSAALLFDRSSPAAPTLGTVDLR